MLEVYKTGEEPMCGDIVKGFPNYRIAEITGRVVALWEGSLSILYLEPKEIFPERVYGEAKDFELVTRNGGGYGV